MAIFWRKYLSLVIFGDMACGPSLPFRYKEVCKYFLLHVKWTENDVTAESLFIVLWSILYSDHVVQHPGTETCLWCSLTFVCFVLIIYLKQVTPLCNDSFRLLIVTHLVKKFLLWYLKVLYHDHKSYITTLIVSHFI